MTDRSRSTIFISGESTVTTSYRPPPPGFKAPPPSNTDRVVSDIFRDFCRDEKCAWKAALTLNGVKKLTDQVRRRRAGQYFLQLFNPDNPNTVSDSWLEKLKFYYTTLHKIEMKHEQFNRLSQAAQQLSEMLKALDQVDCHAFVSKLYSHVAQLLKPGQNHSSVMDSTWGSSSSDSSESEEEPPPPPRKLDRLASVRSFEVLYEQVKQANGVGRKQSHTVGGKKPSLTRKRNGSLPTLRRTDTPSQKTNGPKNPFQEFTEKTQAFYENMTALYTTLRSTETIEEFVHAKSMSGANVLFRNLKLRLDTLLTSEEMGKTAGFLKTFNPTMSKSDADKGLLPWKEYYTLMAKLHLAAHLFGGCASFSENKTLEAQFRLCSERLTQLPMQFNKMIGRLDKPENAAARQLLTSVNSHVQGLLKENNQWLGMAASFSRAALDDKPPEFADIKRTVLNDRDFGSAVERMVDTTRIFYKQIDQLNLALKKVEDKHVRALVLAKKKGSHKKQKKQAKQDAPLSDKEKAVLFLLNEFKAKVSGFSKSLERMMVSTLLSKLPKSLEDSSFLATFPERMRNYYAMIRDIRTYAYVFNACATFSNSIVSNVSESVDIARIMDFAKKWLEEEPYHWQVLLSKVAKDSPAHKSFSKVAQILKKDVAKTPYDLKLLFAYRDALPKKNKLVSAPLSR